MMSCQRTNGRSPFSTNSVFRILGSAAKQSRQPCLRRKRCRRKTILLSTCKTYGEEVAHSDAMTRRTSSAKAAPTSQLSARMTRCTSRKTPRVDEERLHPRSPTTTERDRKMSPKRAQLQHLRQSGARSLPASPWLLSARAAARPQHASTLLWSPTGFIILSVMNMFANILILTCAETLTHGQEERGRDGAQRQSIIPLVRSLPLVVPEVKDAE